MDKKLIYIADDEIKICEIMKSFLIKESFKVESFQDGRSILEAFDKKPADMLIIDIMMPEIDGYSLCSSIREKSSVPIIIVSARDSEPDKVAGLTLGGDDYLTKPFSPMELIARVKSIFRRIEYDRKLKEDSSSEIRISDLTLLPQTKQAVFKGSDLKLTVMEFNLIFYLARNRNKAVSRDELLDKVWGFENDVETRATDDMVKRIRKKIASSGSILEIETVWGFGFKIMDGAEGR